RFIVVGNLEFQSRSNNFVAIEVFKNETSQVLSDLLQLQVKVRLRHNPAHFYCLVEPELKFAQSFKQLGFVHLSLLNIVYEGADFAAHFLRRDFYPMLEAISLVFRVTRRRKEE